jgi:hypothetical protein
MQPERVARKRLAKNRDGARGEPQDRHIAYRLILMQHLDSA